MCRALTTLVFNTKCRSKYGSPSDDSIKYCLFLSILKQKNPTRLNCFLRAVISKKCYRQRCQSWCLLSLSIKKEETSHPTKYLTVIKSQISFSSERSFDRCPFLLLKLLNARSGKRPLSSINWTMLWLVGSSSSNPKCLWSQEINKPEIPPEETGISVFHQACSFLKVTITVKVKDCIRIIVQAWSHSTHRQCFLLKIFQISFFALGSLGHMSEVIN